MQKKQHWTFPKLGTVPDYHHFWLLSIWVVYLALYVVVEHAVTTDYWVSYLPLDDKIPFCEYFIIPYCTWHPLLFLMTAYLAFYDRDTFRDFMVFIAVGLISALIVCWVFPNGQELRPAEFPRHNVFTWLVSRIYAADNNANVCPSMHVIGCFGLVAAAFRSPGLRNRHLQWVMLPLSDLICLSTVFVKQHSVLDIFVAIPYGTIAWLISFRPWKKRPHTA